MPPLIRRGGVDDVDAVANLIATAFEPLDASAYLVPPAKGRRSVLAADFRIVVAHGVKHGEVHMIGDGPAAAAVWVPCTTSSPEPPPDYDRRLEAATGIHAARFRELDALFEKYRPDKLAYHHLALLAVDPAYQRRGLGSALLRHHLALLDRIGMAAYLEASSLEASELYRRHDFQLRDIFRLPDGTAFRAMLRPARAGRAA